MANKKILEGIITGEIVVSFDEEDETGIIFIDDKNKYEELIHSVECITGDENSRQIEFIVSKDNLLKFVQEYICGIKKDDYWNDDL